MKRLKLFKRNKLKSKINSETPDSVMNTFGKFYVFSIAYLVFFYVVFPFFLIYRINTFNCVAIIIFLSLFYIYMIIDVKRKRKNFISSLYVFLIFLVIVSISFSIIKLVTISWKYL